jgi:hypothetical protein
MQCLSLHTVILEEDGIEISVNFECTLELELSIPLIQIDWFLEQAFGGAITTLVTNIPPNFLTSTTGLDLSTGTIIGVLTIRNANNTMEGIYSCQRRTDSAVVADQNQRQFEACLFVLGKSVCCRMCMLEAFTKEVDKV